MVHRLIMGEKCIIPVIIWSMKKAQKIHQKSIVNMDVMLTVRDRMIYKDDTKLNVSYSERDHEVWLDDMHDAGKHNHYCITFSATVIEDDMRGFIDFCRDNGVEIETFNEQ